MTEEPETQKNKDENKEGDLLPEHCPEGQDAIQMARLAKDLVKSGKILLHIALDDARAAELSDLLSFFDPDVEVVKFPAWDCLPYDRISPHPEITAARAAALARFCEWEKAEINKPRIVITTVNASVQKVAPKTSMSGAVRHLKSGLQIDRDELEAFLVRNGYERVQTVRESGEFSVRGSIVDIFPSGFEKPVRVDLFGDEIDNIRNFDPESQVSEEKVKELNFYPAREFFLDADSIAKFRSGYRKAFGVVNDVDPLYEAISEGRFFSGADHWMPLFYDDMSSLFDYFSEPVVTLDRHVKPALVQRVSQIEDFYQARVTIRESEKNKKKSKEKQQVGSVYNPLDPARLYLSEVEWDNYCSKAEEIEPDGAKRGRDFTDIRIASGGDNLYREVGKYILNAKVEKKTVILAAYSDGSASRLKSLIEPHSSVKFIDTKSFIDSKRLKADQVALCSLPLERGFVSSLLCIVTEQDILGDRMSRRASKRKKKADNFLREVSSLNEGDLVAHIEHGVGRFAGLETLKAAGTLHDCLKIEYSGGDKLFVPVENIEVLSRYGGDSETSHLDKLGGVAWQARKAKVKKDLMEIAGHLIEIAASRKMKKCEEIEVDKDLYNGFSAGFPYSETDDQERAIDHVINDLASGSPMDRLVCGDVGFGKTEVAMRAAYVAAINGYQVAVAVPTTLLARQHYQNFVKRFAGTGIRVQQLSRMLNSKEISRVKDELAEGTVNVVVGTHALFGKNVKFANLGLVIVDEEQRFGVKQKEKLKELSDGVHVLTLTATPIPRTLQMALTGVRDMSIIATPPVDRLAIRTFVMPFDPVVVREALLRERYRGGQSFYVCPRVKDLVEVEESIKELVPEVRVITAHGQMSATELEDRMTAFYDGQYDVLIATNIIESGIDVPTANTMIVHRSDMFGLSQLYQIRGRIGRSKVRAYAYLTYEPTKKLSDNAIKRLEAIETLDTLGAGFQLASHDMDIRGAGNLLGEEQSGHIREVGVELYQQMLEEAVALVKSGNGEGLENADSGWSPNINVGMSVLIPESYVSDLSVRMSLYRRVGDLKDSESLDAFAAEVVDRFGEMPEEFENLLKIVEMKQLCLRCNIESIEAGPKGALISFRNNQPPKPDKLLEWMMKRGGTVKLRPDHKISIIRNWEKVKDRVKGVKTLANEIARVVG